MWTYKKEKCKYAKVVYLKILKKKRKYAKVVYLNILKNKNVTMLRSLSKLINSFSNYLLKYAK